jgi:hypothetical protein
MTMVANVVPICWIWCIDFYLEHATCHIQGYNFCIQSLVGAFGTSLESSSWGVHISFSIACVFHYILGVAK